MVLVDANVLLDVLQDDPTAADRSRRSLENAKIVDSLAFNTVIYSQWPVSVERIKALGADLSEASLSAVPNAQEALLLARKAVVKRRRLPGEKQKVLPDSYIGAHAAVGGFGIWAHDVAGHGTYFPPAALIVPPPL